MPLVVMKKGKIFDDFWVRTRFRSQPQPIFPHPAPMRKTVQAIPLHRVTAS
jgi:hypothetical protein